jgi:hypothetical protein
VGHQTNREWDDEITDRPGHSLPQILSKTLENDGKTIEKINTDRINETQQ